MGDLFSEIGASTDGTEFIHGWRYEAGTVILIAKSFFSLTPHPTLSHKGRGKLEEKTFGNRYNRTPKNRSG
jgi:hypothetical protein